MRDLTVDSSERPSISVVLPCFNAGRFLPRALECLRAQTFSNFEIIIVDDGSTDVETVALLNSLPSDIRIVRQPNRGLASARNAGFRAARAPLVLPLDCDDWISPDFLERVSASLEAHPEAAFAFTDIELHGERSGILHKAYNTFEQLFLNQLPYCLLIRRDAWVAVDGYDETMRDGYEDWEFNIRLSRNGFHGYHVTGPLFHYWVSSSGMLHSRSRRLHSQLWSYIQAKHRDLYRISHLYQSWVQHRDRMAAYPGALYAALLLHHRLLAPRFFNAIFSALFRGFGASQAAETRARSANLARTLLLQATRIQKEETSSRPSSSPSQSVVDSVWAITLLSTMIMAPVSLTKGAHLNIVAYDLVAPALFGYLAYRGYLRLTDMGPVVIASGIFLLVISHAAIVFWIESTPRPFFMIRDLIKLGEAIFLTALYITLFRNPAFMRPSRPLMLGIVGFTLILALGVRLLERFHFAALPETVFMSGAAGLCALWSLRAEKTVTADWITSLVGLALVVTSYTLSSKTFALIGLVAAMAPLVFPYLEHRNRSRAVTLTTLGLLVLLAATGVSAFVWIKDHDPMRHWLGSAQSASHSFGIRYIIWSDAWQKAIHSFPLGIGIGQFETTIQITPEISQTINYVHNTLLTVATEMGVLGIGFFVGVAWLLFRSLRTLPHVSQIVVGTTVGIPLIVHDVQSFRIFHILAAMIICSSRLVRPRPHGMSLSIGSAIFSRAAAYVTMIIAARLLAPDNFGAFAVAMTIAPIVSAFVSGGGDLWLNRFVRARNLQHGVAPASWSAYLAVAVVLAAMAVGVAGAAWLFDQLPREYGLILLVAVIGASFAGIAECCLAILRASGRVTTFFTLRDFGVPIALLTLVIALQSESALALVWIYTFVWVIALAAAAGYLVLNSAAILPPSRRYFFRLLPLAFSHTFGLIYGNLGSRLAANLDTLVISAVISLADTGAYRMVAQFSIGLIVLQHFMLLGLPWQLGRSARGTFGAAALAEASRRQLLLIVLSAFAVAALIVSNKFFLGFIGPQFAAFSAVFSFLLLLRFLELLWGPQHEILVSHGRVILDAHANVIAICAWISSFALLSGDRDYVAVAVTATATSSLAGQWFRYYMIRRQMLPRVLGHPFGPYLPAFGTAALAVVSMRFL